MGKYLPDIRQGDTYRVRIRYPKGSNIAGYIHWLALRTAIGTEPPLLLLRSVVGEHPSDQPEDGIAYLEATPEQTAALPANKRCVYGLLAKTPSGEVKTLRPPLKDPLDDRILIVPRGGADGV
ncbi:hypothetical protein [Methylococcus capsulatus]|uniref:Uncharacterized protein n=1 Tax=Methylococcus capsulatus (strain ATCC 33009 / NCIMB 11132 / Bath) TaxID=243233 RepID=Q602X7_METCA|nr:hypothetical protein [Methylococcus capsulatus]AAU90975.1 hypothetical protein MCA2931 [Methylococcus capsulatus str. Bath]QXP93033.1 hypothetical protein KW113_11770 [Methylococcus capsulatus]